MKKIIFMPYVLFLTLCVLPLSCATKEAAEKPQSAPVRQEQDAVPAKPDAVSGATIDGISGATVSRAPAEGSVMPPSAEVSDNSVAAPVQPHAVPPISQDFVDNTARSVDIASVVSGSDEAELVTTDNTDASHPAVAARMEAAVLVPAVRRNTLSDMSSDMPAPAAAAQDMAAAPVADSTVLAVGVNDSDAFGMSDAESAEPESDMDVSSTALGMDSAELAPGTEMSTSSAVSDITGSEPEFTHGEHVYEQTLADIIREFEEQGGSHSYEPPRTFHEQMRDLFSPQVFSVALSKEPETEQKVKVSRMVAVEEKQRLELTYPGHGWVYVGEQTSQQGLKYEQRKLQDNNSIFMFTAEKKGDYVLHFSYFDVFTNDFITDAVAVSVSAARSSAAKSMVQAPEYKIETDDAEKTEQTQSSRSEQLMPAQQAEHQLGNAGIGGTRQSMQAGNVAADRTGNEGVSNETAFSVTAAESEAVQDAALTPEQLLENARTAIAAADANAALQYLERFFTVSTEKLDDGLFLRGRAYELNGSVRNIRLALDAYRTLTADFPQSKYWAEADSRIRYITNFYVNIQ